MRMTRKRRSDKRSVEAKKRGLQTAVMGGMIAMMATPAYAVPANDALPTGGQFMGASAGSILAANGVMNVDQVGANAAIKWDTFNVGANATVNFSHDGGSMAGAYKVLNFSQNGGLPSEIFGRMKAGDMADVWLVNPNGVLIGKGAQIDVGYMHLATHDLNDTLLNQMGTDGVFTDAAGNLLGEHTMAEVMSLGNLYVNQITFDGDRVVIDFDKLHTFGGKRVQLGEEGYLDAAGNAHEGAGGTGELVEGVYIGTGKSSMSGVGSGYTLVNNTTKFALEADTGMSKYLGTATTDSEGNIVYSKNYLEVGNHAKELVAGYTVYDKDATAAHDPGQKGSYENSGKWRGIYANLANNHTGAERVGFAWVEDSTQLERIGEGHKTLARDYALKDGIAAVNTREMNDNGTNKLGFKPIGYDTSGTTTADVTPFSGKFDGLGYDIYGLTINRANENDVGLFGSTKNAIIRNVSLVSGAIVGNENVGGIVGKAENTYIENVRNSARVLGVNNVGGIAGYMSGPAADASGDFTGGSTIDGGYNVALVRGNQDVGGIVGKMDNGSSVIGDTYNTGAVRGIVNFKIADAGYATKTADDLTQAVYDIDNKNKLGSAITGYTKDEAKKANIYYAGTKDFSGNNIVGPNTYRDTDVQINQSSAEAYYITNVDISKFSFRALDGTTLNGANLTPTQRGEVKDLLESSDGFKPGSSFTYNNTTYYVSDMDAGAIQVKASNGLGGVTGDAIDVAIRKTFDPTTKDGVLTNSTTYKYELVINMATDNEKVLMGGGSADIGGIAGSTANSIIGNTKKSDFTIYNGADIRGGNTVGGIAGSISDNSTLQNLRNEGNVLAVGFKMSDDYIYSDRDGSQTRNAGTINISNVGGIVGEASGSNISNVENVGDVTTDTAIKRQAAITQIDSDDYIRDDNTVTDTEYYVGGNVGGIAGSIYGTNISDATNTENKVFGAHNVGGIVGMMSNSHVSNSTNDGGRVIGTGAVKGENIVGTVYLDRRTNSFDNTVRENAVELYKNQDWIRYGSNYIIGNVGGIAGYMFDNPGETNRAVYSSLKDVRNRGDVSTQELLDPARTNVLYDVNLGVNIGGVVGKVVQGRAQHRDSLLAFNSINNTAGQSADVLKKRMLNAMNGKTEGGIGPDGKTELVDLTVNGNAIHGALISGAANTGSVKGINGVGGVAGQVMYAAVANSYNMGNVSSGATIASSSGGTAGNIGGVIGEATGGEHGNQGQYNSTPPEQYGAYLYNVYNSGVVGDKDYVLYGRHMGGVVGRIAGTISNSYNTGDVYNATDTTGGVVGYLAGGLVQDVFNAGNVTVSTRPGVGNDIAVGGVVSTAYDGSINRAYNLGVVRSFDNGFSSGHQIAGIIVRKYAGHNVNVSNVYSTGELGAYVWHEPNGTGRPVKEDGTFDFDNFGYRKDGTVHAIAPDIGFSHTSSNAYFIRPSDAPNNNYNNSAYNAPSGSGSKVTVIQYDDRYDITKYGGFGFATTTERVDASSVLGHTVQEEIDILNEFGITGDDAIANSLAQSGVYKDAVTGEYYGVKTTTHYTDTKMKAGDDSLAWRMYQYDDVTGKSLYRDAQGNYNDVDGNVVYAHDNAEGLKHVRATLPTLNAMAPGGYMYYKPYDASAPAGQKGHEDILYTQIGNEYNPVTSFVQLRDGKDALNLDFLGLAAVSTPGARDGIVVNNGNLNITNVVSDQFFSGVYGASGSVNVVADTGGTTAQTMGTAPSNRLNMASDAAIYGKDITITNVSGDIYSLGNLYAYDGDVTLKGKNVDVFGSVLSGSKYYSHPPTGATAPALTWPDGTPLITKQGDGASAKYFAEIQDTGRTVDFGENYAPNGTIMDPNSTIRNKSYMYQKSLEIKESTPGNILISTALSNDENGRPVVNDGRVNLSFGNGGTGRVRTDGDLTLVAKDVEVDADISVGLTRTGYASTGSVFKIIADNSIFDVSNIGSYGSSDGIFQTVEESQAAKIRLLMFMAHFADTDASALNNKLVFEAVEGGKADAKLALNMYGGYERLADGTYRQVGENELNLKKYNLNPDDGYYYELYKQLSGVADVDSETALFEFLPKLNVYNGTDGEGANADKRVAQQYSYTNIKNAEQLKNIQTYMVEKNSSAPMHLNWLLRNNIDASDIDDFHTLGAGIKEANGTDAEFTGKFNGNGYDLNSLTLHDTTGNVGLFTTIGESGIVSDLNINASRLEGNGTRIGLIAGTNKGIIDTINTFGNTVKDDDYQTTTDHNRDNPHFIGGLVGLNQTTGFINNVSVEDIVYSEATHGLADVGGISGLNAGIIYQSTGKSDASVADGGATSLGGITGVNAGILGAVYATGVTNGLYDRTMTANKDYVGALNVGGIAGENRTAYITKDGVVDTSNTLYKTKDKFGDYVVDPLSGKGEMLGGGLIRDAYNDSKVTGWSNVGGVVGQNFGAGVAIDNGLSGADKQTGTTGKAGTAYYISNAGDVTGGGNVGGLVGVNNGILKGDAELNLAGVRTEQVNAAGNKIYGQLMTSYTDIGDIDLDATSLTTAQRNAIITRYGTLLGITSSSTDAQIIGAMQTILKQLFYERQITGTAAQNAEAQVLYGRNTGKIEGIRGMKDNNNTYSTGTNVGGLIGISQEQGDVHFLLNGKAASVYGFQNVGGLIGQNEGVLQESRNMMEDNEISGIINVGGIVGENANKGVIYGVKNETKFNITVNDDYYKNGAFNADLDKDPNVTVSADRKTITIGTGSGAITYDSPKYFGGVLGHNAQGGIVADAENYANVSVSGAEFVGGIIGRNEGTLGEKNQYIVLTGANRGKLVNAKPSGTAGVDYYAVKGQYINYGAVGADLTPVSALVPTNPTVTNHTPANGDTAVATTTTGVSVNEASGEITVTETHKNAAGQDVSTVVTKYIPGTSSYVGGIIGRNDSSLQNVDLVNHASGFVMGKDYVGGIVGGNVGNITGARDAGNTGKGNYYEDLVYNNGAIVATGQYAGGIAGQNTGNVKLAYNTGTVMSNATSTGLVNSPTSAAGYYVGGIVGQNNGGTIQEVFSSLAAGDTPGTGDFIKGDRYVGGIAGENAAGGILKNTYSIGSVRGAQSATQVGNLVGSNSGDVTYSYSTAESGRLIGAGTRGGVGTYTFSAADTTAYGSNGTDQYLDDAERKVGESYKGYDAQTSGGNNVWKFYDGQTTPILKNFLTNVYYTGDPEDLNLVYNANKQGVVVTPTADGKIRVTRKDNGAFLGYIYSVDQKGTHADADFLGTYTNDLSTDLIIGNQNAKDAGEYTMFSSQQIKTINNTDHGVNGLGVNNLGYNFVTLKNKPATDPPADPPEILNEEIKFEIKKKELSITGNDVHRTYGNQALTQGTSYGQTITGWVGGENFTQGIIIGTTPSANDTAIKGLAANRTADASVTGDASRTYYWTNTARMDRDNYEGLKNYTFVANTDSTTANYRGGSIVDRANLSVNLNHFAVLYGDKYGTDGSGINTVTVDSSGNYKERTGTTVKAAENTILNAIGLTNGDTREEVFNVTTLNDAAFIDRGGYLGTANVGNDYVLSATGTDMHSENKTGTMVTGGISKDQNYNVTIYNGTVDVVKRPVVVVDNPNNPPTEDQDHVYVYGNNISRTYGNETIGTTSRPATDYGITVKGLADWDAANQVTLNTVTKENDGAIAGTSGGKKTNDAGDYYWTSTVNISDAIKDNYNIGNTTVKAESDVEKAKLNIKLNNVTMAYGSVEGSKTDAATYTDYDHVLNGGIRGTYDFTLEGVVNNDVIADIKAGTTIDKDSYNNGGFKADGHTNAVVWDTAKTNPVDGYDLTLKNGKTNVAINEAIWKNYELENVENGRVTITPAIITAQGNTVYRTYGNTVIKDSSTPEIVDGSGNPTYHHSGDQNADDKGLSGWAYDEKDDIHWSKITVDTTGGTITDGALAGGSRTSDVGEYQWSNGTIKIDIDSLTDDEKLVANNYRFYKDGAYSMEGTVGGLSIVEKANLNVTLGNTSTVYGTAFDDDTYTVTGISGLTNGDDTDDTKSATILAEVNAAAKGNYINDYAKNGTNGVWTGDAGSYAGKLGLNKEDASIDIKNYNIVGVTNGNIDIEKYKLHIKANDVTMAYGAVEAGDTVTTDAAGVAISGVNKLYGADLMAGSTGTDKSTVTSVNGVSLSDVYSVNGYTNSGYVDVSTNSTKDVVYDTDGKTPVTAADRKLTASVAVNTTNDKNGTPYSQNFEIASNRTGDVIITPNIIAAQGGTVYRTYGNQTMYDKTKTDNTRTQLDDYGASSVVKDSAGNIIAASNFTQTGDNSTITDAAKVNDGTNNVGNYQWQGATLAINDATGAMSNNRFWDAANKEYVTTQTVFGDSIVEKAALTVKLNEQELVYGNGQDFMNYGIANSSVTGQNGTYAAGSLTGVVTNSSATVTGEASAADIIAKIDGVNNAFKDNGAKVIYNGQVRTNDVDTYALNYADKAAAIGAINAQLQNYEVVDVEDGKVTITPRPLDLGPINAEVQYGSDQWKYDTTGATIKPGGTVYGQTVGVDTSKINVVTSNHGGAYSTSLAANGGGALTADVIRNTDGTIGSYVGDLHIKATDLESPLIFVGDTNVLKNYKVGAIDAGDIKVTPATINVQVNSLTGTNKMTYGDKEADHVGKYGYTFVDNLGNAVTNPGVNGDTLAADPAHGNTGVLGTVTYNNTGINQASTNKVTKDAGNDYRLQITGANGITMTGTNTAYNQNYDINIIDGAVEVGKKTITLVPSTATVNGNTVYRTYGDDAIKANTKSAEGALDGLGAYGVQIGGLVDAEGNERTPVYQELDKAGQTAALGSDTGLDHNPDDNKLTSNVGNNYTWNSSFTLTGDLDKNYTFGTGDGISSDGKTIAVTGKSEVEKAKLTINMNDFSVLYGDKYSDTLHTIKVTPENKYDSRNNGADNLVTNQEKVIKSYAGLANGDTDINAIVTINGVNDEGFIDRGSGIKGTADVGKYDLYATGTNLQDGTLVKDGNNNVTGGVSNDGNYDVTIIKGSVNVVNTPVVAIDPNDPNDPDLPKTPDGKPIPPWNPDPNDPTKPDPNKPFDPNDPDTWNPDFKDNYNPDKVYVYGNIVERTYGNKNITSAGGDYTVNVFGNIADWDAAANKVTVDVVDATLTDGAVSGLNTIIGQQTQNATDGKTPYKWSAAVNVSGDNAGNYEVATGDSVTADSLVHRADLNVTMNDFAVLYGDKYPADSINTAKVDTDGKFDGRTDIQVSTAERYLDKDKVTLANGDTDLDKIIQIKDVDNQAFTDRGNGITGTKDVANGYDLYATDTTLTDTTTDGNGHITSGISADNNYVVTITEGNVDVVGKPVVSFDPKDPDTWPKDPNDPDKPIPPWTPDPDNPTQPDPDNPYDPDDPETWNPEFKDQLDPDKVYVFGKVVERTYGDQTITNNNKTYDDLIIIGAADWDKAEDTKIELTGTINDTAIQDADDNVLTGNKKTNDATDPANGKEYTWDSAFTVNSNANYVIGNPDDKVKADSIINRAQLDVFLNDFTVLYGDVYGDNIETVTTKDGKFDKRTGDKVVDQELVIKKIDGIVNDDDNKVDLFKLTGVEDKAFINRGTEENPLIGTADVGEGYDLNATATNIRTGTETKDGNAITGGISADGNYDVVIHKGSVDVVNKPVVSFDPNDPTDPNFPKDPDDPTKPVVPRPDPNDPDKFDPNDPTTWDPDIFDKDKIYVFGHVVNRTYGDETIKTTATNPSGDYAIDTIGDVAVWDQDVKVQMTGPKTDGAVDGAPDGKETNNATVKGDPTREYKWNSAIDVAGQNKNNYEIITVGDNPGTVTADSIVDKRKLEVNMNNINVLYGDVYENDDKTVSVNADGTFNKRDGGKLQTEETKLTVGTAGDGLADGDTLEGVITINKTDIYSEGTDTAFIPRDGLNGKHGTNDVDKYDLNATDTNMKAQEKDQNGVVTGGISDDQNYEITINSGSVNVVSKPIETYDPENPPTEFDPDKIYVAGNDVKRTYGDATVTNKQDPNDPDYTITIKGNGASWDKSLEEVITLNPVDKADDGGLDTTGKPAGAVTNDAGDYKWNGTINVAPAPTGGANTNYTITTNAGNGNKVIADSTVDKAKLVIDMNEFAVLYGDKYADNEFTVKTDANGNFDHRTTTFTQDAEKVIKVNSGSTLANGDTLAGVINMDTVNNSAFINRGTEENPLIGTADVKDGYGMTANTVKVDGSTAATTVGDDSKVESKNYVITINAGSVDVVSKPIVTYDPNDPDNPPPPGFDPDDPTTYDPDKIYVIGNDVERTYGNATINPNGNVHDYGITIKGEGAEWDKPINEVITLNPVTKPNDGAIAGTTGNRVTNDVDKYTWNGTINVDDTSESTDPAAKPNYTIVTNGGNGTVSADSTVTKAKLDVYLNDFTILYGDERNENTLNNLYTVNKGTDGKYESRTDVTLREAENTFYNSADKDNVMTYDDIVLNGDKLSDVVDIAIQNGGFELKPNGVMGSLNAGQSGDLTGTDSKGNGNYDVTIYKGIVDVVAKPVVTFDPENPPPGIDPDDPKTFDPDKIYVVGNDVERTYGDATVTNKKPTDPDYTITIHGNGATWDKPLEEVITLNPVNKADDGAVKGTSGDKQTNDAGDYEWKGTINVNTPNNYDITTNGGNGNKVVADSTVNKAQLVIDMNEFAVLYGDKYADNENTVNVVNGQFDSRTDVKTQDAEKIISVNKDSALANGDKLEDVINVNSVNDKAFVDRGGYAGTADVANDYTLTAKDVMLDKDTTATAVGNDGKVESKNYEITINAGNVDVVSKPVVTLDPNDPGFDPPNPDDPTDWPKDPDGDPIPPFIPDPNDPTKPDPDHPFDPNDPGTWNPEFFDKDKIYVFGNDVERTYGDPTINPNGNVHDYGITIRGEGADWDDPIKDIITLNPVDKANDGAVAGTTGDRVTNNVGEYTWDGTINVDNQKPNYTIVTNGGNGTVSADSTVNKAQLVINLDDYKVLYGDIKSDDLQTITGSGNDFKRDGDTIGNIENKNWQKPENVQGVSNGDKIENILDMTTGTDAFTDRTVNGQTVQGTKNPATGYDHNAGTNNLKKDTVTIGNGQTKGESADGNYDVVINHGNVDVLAKPVVPIDPNNPETFPKDPDTGDPIKPYPPNPPTGFDPDDPNTYPPGFDPNDPGTWDPGIFDKDPDRIYVFGNTVNRTYGDTDINKTPDNPNGEYDVIVKGNGAAWDPDINDLINLSDPVDKIVGTDGAILPDGEHTNNATVGKDPYHWNSGITVDNTPGYDIVTNGGEPGKVQGNSTVDRATLNIKLDDYKVLYGDVKGDDPHTIVIDPATGKPVRTDKPVSQVEKNWQNTATGVTNGDTINDILTMGTNTDAFINRGTDENGNPILGTNNVGDGYGHTVGDNNMTGTSTSGNQTTGVSADGNYDVVIDHGNVGVVARPVTPINPNDPTTWPTDPSDPSKPIPPFTPDPNAPGYDPNDPGTWTPDPNKPYNPNDPGTWNPDIFKDRVVVVGDTVDRTYGDPTVTNKPDPNRPDYNINIIGKPDWDKGNVVELDNGSIDDGAIPNDPSKPNKVTNNAGEYDWEGNLNPVDPNYQLDRDTVVADSNVNKRPITIIIDDHGNITTGDQRPMDGSTIQGGTNGDVHVDGFGPGTPIANGDTIDQIVGWDYETNRPIYGADGNANGTPGGFVVGTGNPNFNGLDPDIYENYDITILPGDGNLNQKQNIEFVDHSHEVNNNGDQRHWRERKAETNFYAGGGDFFNDMEANDGISHVFDDILAANMIDIRPDGTVEIAEYDEDGNLIADGEHTYDKEGNIVAGVVAEDEDDDNNEDEE